VLIASMVKLAGTSHRDKASDPSSVLSGMNAALFGNTQKQLLTAAYVHLDSESRELRYSAAGHPPMLLLRDGKVTEVVENGLMLAAFDFTIYSNAVQRLQSGDRLLLYTDGLVEAALGRILWAGGARNATTADRRGCAQRYCGPDYFYCAAVGAPQDDDLTVLACDYIGVG
jgi:sigma-B regulation protein RsbU (phosphoserine phosphatase)